MIALSSLLLLTAVLVVGWCVMEYLSKILEELRLIRRNLSGSSASEPRIDNRDIELRILELKRKFLARERGQK